MVKNAWDHSCQSKSCYFRFLLGPNPQEEFEPSRYYVDKLNSSFPVPRGIVIIKFLVYLMHLAPSFKARIRLLVPSRTRLSIFVL